MRRLMDDPAYAAYYNETMDMLTEAEKAAENAMAYFASQRAAARQALDEMLENATHLKGYGAVFKDGDKVRLLDGTVIDDPVLLEMIVWKENNQTYDAAATLRDKESDFGQSFEEAERYRTETLGEVRHTMEGEDVSVEKIEELRNVIADQPDSMGFKEINPTYSTKQPAESMAFSNTLATPAI